MSGAGFSPEYISHERAQQLARAPHQGSEVESAGALLKRTGIDVHPFPGTQRPEPEPNFLPAGSAYTRTRAIFTKTLLDEKGF